MKNQFQMSIIIFFDDEFAQEQYLSLHLLPYIQLHQTYQILRIPYIQWKIHKSLKIEGIVEQNFQNWQQLIKQNLSGGGQYDENGQKTGNQIELSYNFSIFIQITFEGEYLNGKKIQKWRTLHINLQEDKMKKIGGGLYDKNGMKDGKWVEMFDNILQYKEFSFNGKQNEGRRQGRSDYKIKKKEYIGGGLYKQNGKKNGIWVELSDYYKEDFQIIWIGKYDNGEKCGKWEKMLRKDKKEAFVKGREEFYDIANNKK